MTRLSTGPVAFGESQDEIVVKPHVSLVFCGPPNPDHIADLRFQFDVERSGWFAATPVATISLTGTITMRCFLLAASRFVERDEPLYPLCC